MIELSEGPEGKDFVAPDDSERVIDPAEAEIMARGSKSLRDRAVELRQGTNIRDSGLTAKKRKKLAFLSDQSAEGKEEWEGMQYRVSQMDRSALEQRHNELVEGQRQTNRTINAYGGEEPSSQSSGDYRDALHKRDFIEAELSAIEQRLTEI